jgi:uncharacterized repeat protein (TIGR04138 family)
VTDTLDLLQNVKRIAERRGVFRAEAYYFVLEALETAMEAREERGHIAGGDLLDEIRRLAADRYGVMAGDVFRSWGVNATIDFGRVVFHLVEEGLLRKRDEDSLRDFIDKFDFEQAFSLKTLRGEA